MRKFINIVSGRPHEENPDENTSNLFEETLDEYQEVPPQNFTPLTPSGPSVGSINANGNIFDIYREEDGETLVYIARLRGQSGDADCQLVFLKMSGGNALIGKNAWTNTEYRGIGVASELMHFVNDLDEARGHQPILSDTQMSQDGVGLWKSLMKSGQKVFDN